MATEDGPPDREAPVERHDVVGLFADRLQAAGAILGGLATVLVPVAGMAVAGGTVLAAAMGGTTGGATGMVAGLLFGAAASPDRGTYYAQEVQRGRSLVTVSAPPAQQGEVRRIMLEVGAMEAAPMSPEGS